MNSFQVNRLAQNVVVKLLTSPCNYQGFLLNLGVPPSVWYRSMHGMRLASAMRGLGFAKLVQYANESSNF